MIGTRLKQRRIELGLSQKKLSDIIGISQAAINRIENLKAKRTRYINQFAKALNVSVDWLATGEGEMLIPEKENELERDEMALLQKAKYTIMMFLKYTLLVFLSIFALLTFISLATAIKDDPAAYTSFIGLVFFSGMIFLVYREIKKQRLNKPADTNTNRAEDAADEYDAWEDILSEESNPINVSVELAIAYSDAEGQKTERDITVRSYDGGVECGLIKAYCHRRKSPRTFRVDRITHAVDRKTGEIIATKALDDYFLARYEKSPIGALNNSIEANPHAMKIFYFIMKADNRVTAAEKNFLLDYYKKETGNHELTIQHLNVIIRDHPIVPFTHYIKSVAAIKSTASFPNIVKTAKAIAGTSKEENKKTKALKLLD